MSGIGFDGLYGCDEVCEVVGEGWEGGFEIRLCGGEFRWGGMGGEGMDVDVRGEEGLCWWYLGKNVFGGVC